MIYLQVLVVVFHCIDSKGMHIGFTSITMMARHLGVEVSEETQHDDVVSQLEVHQSAVQLSFFLLLDPLLVPVL